MRGPLTAWLVATCLLAGGLAPCPAAGPEPRSRHAAAAVRPAASHGMASHAAGAMGHAAAAGGEARTASVDAPCPCGCGEREAASPAGRLGLAIPEAPVCLTRPVSAWPDADAPADPARGSLRGVDHVPRPA